MNNLSINVFTVKNKKSMVALCLSKNNFTLRVNLLLSQCNNDADVGVADDIKNYIKNMETRRYLALIKNVCLVVFCTQSAEVKHKKLF